MQALNIPINQLLLAQIPLLLLFAIFYKYQMNWKELLWAAVRMILQLVAVGYFLTFLFSQESSLNVLAILLFMVLLSSWIALRSIKSQRPLKYRKALLAQLVGATPVLLWVVLIVLPGGAFSEARVMIPLAGMVYANGMNTLSLAAERFASEIRTQPLEEAFRKALTAAYIPHINMFMAVGMVSLPGLMTGQILSGVDPLVAVRYQIVVITLIFASAGFSAFLFLWQWKRELLLSPQG